MDWIMQQISEFNFVQFLFTLFFIVSFQKSNTTKLLDKQTREIHSEIEEVKDTIREVMIR
jgi:F0F1-type ATP synthase membrane subunit b/b'